MILSSAAEKNLVGQLALVMKNTDLAAELMAKSGRIELPGAFVTQVHREIEQARKIGWPRGEKGELLMQVDELFRTSTFL